MVLFGYLSAAKQSGTVRIHWEQVQAILLTPIHILDAYEDFWIWCCQRQQSNLKIKAEHTFSPAMSWVVPTGKTKTTHELPRGSLSSSDTNKQKLQKYQYQFIIYRWGEPSCEMSTQLYESLSNAPGPGAPILPHRTESWPSRSSIHLHLIKRPLRGRKAAYLLLRRLIETVSCR
jgi:hypothetical protein